jgi:heptose-I-phosphate ethanolaminephosphotransferase
MMKNIKKIVAYMIAPIQNDFSEFLCLILLQSFCGILFVLKLYDFTPPMAIDNCQINTLIGVLVYAILFSYVAMLVKCYGGKIGRLIFKIFIVLVCIYQLINLVCICTLHISYSLDFSSVVAGTNIGEVSEFILTYVKPRNLALILFSIFVLVAIIFLIKKRSMQINRTFSKKVVGYLWGICLLVCIPLGCTHTNSVGYYQSLLGLFKSLSSYEPVVEIQSTHPSLVLEKQTEVPSIVVVIGESHSKLHSSLYGYEKETNPRLSVLPDSLLHVFRNVEAADLHTIQSFSCFMTTSEKSDIPRCYKCPNIIEIAKESGYQTFWISNQSEYGLYDNKVSIFAHLCDSVIFNGDKSSGASKTDLDDELIPYIKGVAKSNKKSLAIVHLMGSHAAFNRRYSSSYDVFKSVDYNDKPKNQRVNMAQYDNSLLFNDYVVSEIINQYKLKDVVLLYFSDHALDLYNTDPEYCAHAKPDDKSSEYYGRQIPFLVYTSELFRQRHPEITSAIDKSCDVSFNTTNLPYMLMQIMGVTFKDTPNKCIFPKV